MNDTKLREVLARFAAREMATRGRLIHTEPTFATTSVPGSDGRPVSAQLIRHWWRRRLIFGARYTRRDYFPAFQFSGGRPKPIVGRLLEILNVVRREDNWFLFYWFVAANAWLEGDAAPYAVMDADEEAVIEAALHANDRISD